MKYALLLGVCISALCAGHVTAQNYAISPIGAATTEGSSATTFPFTNSTQCRYQQIHSDLKIRPMRITAIGFRQNWNAMTFTGSRTIDFELFMGHSVAWNQASFFFDDNFVQNSKTKVIARKSLVFGPGATANPGPSPFDAKLELKLDKPYVYVPTTGSLAWELLMHSNRSRGTMSSLDADACSGMLGSGSPYGSGCTATGRAARMSQSVRVADRAGTLLLMFSASNCPSNAPALLVLGSRQVNASVPGLCSNLLTDLDLVLPIGVSSASGDLNRRGTTYFYDAAPGIVLAQNPGFLMLNSQIFALDPGQNGIPLASSNGVAITTPIPNISKKAAVTRLFNYTDGLSAKQSLCFTEFSVGYGLVTRFTF